MKIMMMLIKLLKNTSVKKILKKTRQSHCKKSFRMKYKIILTYFSIIITCCFLVIGIYYLYGLIYPKNRILVCISSFKRPLLLSGQILRFQNQTYSDFDISVSVKGAPKKMVRSTFMQEWQALIKK